MPKKKATFQPTVRPDWAGSMDYIPKEEQCQIFQAILMFPSIDVPNSAFWNKTVKPDLQMQLETFIATCEKKAIGIRKRWGTQKGIDNYTDVLDMNTELQDKDTNEKDMIYIVKEKEKKKDKESDSFVSNLEKEELVAPKKTSRFMPPTLEEIKAYCVERKNTVDAERFMNYYDSNGWKVGKNPMKDWKAAVRTWERSGFNTPQKAKSISSPDYVGEGSFLRRAEDDPFCADL